jgi:hypothetical protein
VRSLSSLSAPLSRTLLEPLSVLGVATGWGGGARSGSSRARETVEAKGERGNVDVASRDGGTTINEKTRNQHDAPYLTSLRRERSFRGRKGKRTKESVRFRLRQQQEKQRNNTDTRGREEDHLLTKGWNSVSRKVEGGKREKETNRTVRIATKVAMMRVPACERSVSGGNDREVEETHRRRN